MKTYKNIFSANAGSAVIIVFHIIGAIGIKFKPELFLHASFFNLLLSAVMVFWFSVLNLKGVFVLTGLSILAFAIEVIGVKTHYPFGVYWYGSNLGPKILDVPLIIGVNWILLLYCCNTIFLKKSIYQALIYSSALMVLHDYIMEQNVEKLGFWFWKDSIIPFQNYFSWFCISLIFSFIIRKSVELTKNTTAIVLYITQVLFFVYCYFVI